MLAKYFLPSGKALQRIFRATFCQNTFRQGGGLGSEYFVRRFGTVLLAQLGFCSELFGQPLGPVILDQCQVFGQNVGKVLLGQW